MTDAVCFSGLGRGCEFWNETGSGITFNPLPVNSQKRQEGDVTFIGRMPPASAMSSGVAEVALDRKAIPPPSCRDGTELAGGSAVALSVANAGMALGVGEAFATTSLEVTSPKENSNWVLVVFMMVAG